VEKPANEIAGGGIGHEFEGRSGLDMAAGDGANLALERALADGQLEEDDAEPVEIGVG
jgi:hypothetical protein